MPSCINCRQFTLRDHPGTPDDKSKSAATRLARQGLGRCLLGPAWRFLSPTSERQCAKFNPTEPEVVTQRAQWIAQR